MKNKKMLFNVAALQRGLSEIQGVLNDVGEDTEHRELSPAEAAVKAKLVESALALAAAIRDAR